MSAIFEIGNTDPGDDTDLGFRIRALNAHQLEVDVWDDDDTAGLFIDRDEARKLRDALTAWLDEDTPLGRLIGSTIGHLLARQTGPSGPAPTNDR